MSDSIQTTSHASDLSSFDQSAESRTNWILRTNHGQSSIQPAIAAEVFVEQTNGNLIFHDGNWWKWNSKVWFVEAEISIRAEIRNMLTSCALGRELTRSSVITDILLQAKLILRTESDFLGFNYDSSKIVLQNGTLRMDNFRFEPCHEREDFRSVMLGLDYLPDALCPRWLKFLYEIGLADDTRTRLQEWAGYLLVPSSRLQKCLFLLGDGANGKSVFLMTLKALLGKDNVSSLEMTEMFDRFKIAGLRGKLANIGSDVDTSKTIGAGFKKIVAGEPQIGELKFQEPFEFRPYVRLLFSGNDFLPSKDRSHGFFRRFDVVKFRRTFSNEEQEFDLEEKLRAELSGIFNWALAGLSRLLCNKWIMTKSPEMDEAHSEFMANANPVAEFLSERCLFKTDASVAADILRKDYSNWCSQKGHFAVSDVAFGKEMKRLHPEIAKGRIGVGENRKITYQGMKLID